MTKRFFKIFSLALLAVVVLLGTTAAQKGGGRDSGNKDILLKAMFSVGPIQMAGNGPVYDYGKIRNDDPTKWYVHQGTKSGQNHIYISSPSTAGTLIMSIYAASGRFVNLHFDDMLVRPQTPEELDLLPDYTGCLLPYFIYTQNNQAIVPIKTTYIMFNTIYECLRVDHESDGLGPWAEIVPIIEPNRYCNLAKMSIGQTKIVTGRGNIIPFRTEDDTSTLNYDESQDGYALFQEPQYLTVEATDFDNNGVMDWIIRPFADRYKFQDDKKNWIDCPYGCVPRRVTSSSYRACDHGTYLMPFELRIARK